MTRDRDSTSRCPSRILRRPQDERLDPIHTPYHMTPYHKERSLIDSYRTMMSFRFSEYSGVLRVAK